MKQLQEVIRIDCPDEVRGCVHYMLADGTTQVRGRAMDSYLADHLANSKRLRDEETAAEYWCAKANPRIRAYKRDDAGNILDIPGTGWEYEHQVWRRFATLPHYDEVTA